MTSWLLDTTYILPFFGIDVAILGLRESMTRILASRQHDIGITSLSIIEAKWLSIQQFKKKNDKTYLGRANMAIESLQGGRYMKVTDPWFVKNAARYADRLLELGHKDYFDCWIAGTARAEGRTLVSEDEPLAKLIVEEAHWDDFKMVPWKDFNQEIENKS
jgi:PIN domain nuclease of toxin-antitoxin system